MKYLDDHYYHVYNRGANKERIFRDQENYRFCLQLFAKYATKYGVSIMAFCLMPNHYHLLLQQHEDGSISKFLQTTFNAYTQAFNQYDGRSGTLFESRAKGMAIDCDRYFPEIVRYIHLNPVSAKLVPHPEDWYASDYRVWVDAEERELTDLTLRDENFGRGWEYREFIEAYQHEIPEDELSRLLVDSVINLAKVPKPSQG